MQIVDYAGVGHFGVNTQDPCVAEWSNVFRMAKYKFTQPGDACAKGQSQVYLQPTSALTVRIKMLLLM